MCHFECNEAEKWAKHADFVGIRPKETNETVANPSFSFPRLEWKMYFFFHFCLVLAKCNCVSVSKAASLVAKL